MKFHLDIMQQNSLPCLLGLWHITGVSVSLTASHTFTWTDTYAFEHRHLLVSTDEPKGNCRLVVKSDPLSTRPIDLSGQVIHPHREEGGKYVYVINAHLMKSWTRAEQICQLLGGHLPTITSYEENQYLRNILAGNLFPQIAFRNPCRIYDPLCAIFIGLGHNRVSSEALHLIPTLIAQLVIINHVFYHLFVY